MGKDLLQTVIQTGIFIICAQMLLHFRASKSYEKYIRLFMNVLVLIQLISPVLTFLGQKENHSFEESIWEYESYLNQELLNMTETAEKGELLFLEMTTKEIKSEINFVEEEEDKVRDSEEGIGEENEKLVDRIEVKLGD